jgi:hypothetical protein
MKQKSLFISLFFLILIVTLVFSAAHQVRQDEATGTPTSWLPPQLTPDPSVLTQTPGWWNAMPTAIPFPSPTPKS